MLLGFDFYFCQLYTRLFIQYVNIMWPEDKHTRIIWYTVLIFFISTMIIHALGNDLVKMGSYFIKIITLKDEEYFEYMCNI